jgi:chromosome segregation ATPase
MTETADMTAIADLERRVTALEAAQNDTTQTLRWVVARLGRMSAVQDEHTLRLERIEGDVKRIEGDVKRIEAQVSRIEADVSRVDGHVRRVETELMGLRAELPGIVADAVRDGIRAARAG